MNDRDRVYFDQSTLFDSRIIGLIGQANAKRGITMAKEEGADEMPGFDFTFSEGERANWLQASPNDYFPPTVRKDEGGDWWVDFYRLGTDYAAGPMESYNAAVKRADEYRKFNGQPTVRQERIDTLAAALRENISDFVLPTPFDPLQERYQVTVVFHGHRRAWGLMMEKSDYAANYNNEEWKESTKLRVCQEAATELVNNEEWVIELLGSTE